MVCWADKDARPPEPVPEALRAVVQRGGRVLSQCTGVGADLGHLHNWALAHLHEPITVPDLARRVHMSPRAFARWFAARTGTTSHQWLTSQRLIMAQDLLERTDRGIEQVAADCGLTR
jgi:transcriptional regulator GlxA family with amidase domain